MGAVISWFKEAYPPASKFSVDDIPDLSGKVIIVTGANTGIGKETAKALLNHGAKVYMTARSKQKGLEAIEELKKITGREGIFLELDLADLPSVKRAAEEFLSKEKELHVLFNNAGVMNPPVKMVTAQGYDLQFGTNVLGHWYFTKLLLPVLISTAKSSPSGEARVIHTSSVANLMTSGIDFNTLKDGPARLKSEMFLYPQSKLGNIIVSNEFARRYGNEGVISVSLNPGNLDTELKRHMGPVGKAILQLFLHPAPMGALTQLYAGTTKDGRDLNGKYLIPWARMGKPHPVALDQKIGEELWRWLEEQVEHI